MFAAKKKANFGMLEQSCVRYLYEAKFDCVNRVRGCEGGSGFWPCGNELIAQRADEAQRTDEAQRVYERESLEKVSRVPFSDTSATS